MSGIAIDWLVLTAANEAQARGYHAQLNARRRDGRLASVANTLVVADPKGRRIGSGGSTFLALHELAAKLGTPLRGAALLRAFERRRILIIHSGGDSRRLPAYAAEGKVFVPMPRTLDSGHPATLFDLILEDLTPLVHKGRVLIATGDVLLGIGTHRPDVTGAGMVGIAFPGSASVGSRHGVYVCNGLGRVFDFLQKPDLAEAKRRRALNRKGQLLIDTGVLSLDGITASTWIEKSAELVRQLRKGTGKSIDLYSDMLPALYGRGSKDRRFRPFRVSFRAAIVPQCDFLHIGSTLELLSIATRANSNAHRAVTLNSFVNAKLTQHPTSFVEASRITHRTVLGNHSVLVGFPGGSPLHIRDHCGAAFLPIGRSDWACITFGVKDDFKTPFGRGGTMWNATVHPASTASDDESDISQRTFWDARCWVVGSLSSVLRDTPSLSTAGASEPSTRTRFWNMAELMPRVNIARLVAQRQALQTRLRIEQLIAALRSGSIPSAQAVQAVPTGKRAAIRGALASRLARETNPFDTARLHHLASWLNPSLAAKHEALCFAAIAGGVARSSPPLPVARRAAMAKGHSVIVTAPVRIDLCGGWSDTPPICHELGGCVVNAAVTLDGEHPIRVSARLIDEPELRLRSDDLNKSLTVRSLAEARSHHDPHDWAALPKAAFILAGITPERGSLRSHLAGFGGGVELTMSVNVPKGSGLGTSSILGAAVLACLDRVCGRRNSTRDLIARTSILEQMMSTAGGWQDQAGGITPGIKLLRTRPGPNQVPSITALSIPTAALASLRHRAILYYTGQRRLAKDILQGVVRRYLSGDPAAIRIIHDLKSSALHMSSALSRGDIDAFAAGILRNWELKKSIDPGSTNDRIERIISPLTPLLSGYELAGAGGGGFIFMIARSAAHARRVKSLLARARTPGARLVLFDFDRRGMRIDTTSLSR